jgi:putative transposase
MPWIVEQDGDEIDILVQKRQDKYAAKRYFNKVLKGQQCAPITIVTDKLRSYSATKKELITCAECSSQQYENNRCALCHQPDRQQEMQMRKFKSQGQAHLFSPVMEWLIIYFGLVAILCKAVIIEFSVTERSLYRSY